MRTVKLGCLVGVAIVAAIAGIAAVSSAAPTPQPLTLMCALKGNGLVKVVTGTSQCPPKQGTLLTFSVASPVALCRQPDGSVRLVPPRDCTKASGTMFTVPSNTPAYFCVNLSTGGALRYVANPSLCASGETAFFVTNRAPTDIALTNASVAENNALVTTVGTLSALDPDTGDSHTFTLATGAGDTGNASFTISGSTLKTAASFDYETQSSYSIRVRAKDLLGLTYDETFTITVTDVAEGPIVTTTSGVTAYTENAAAVAVDDGLTVTDDGATLAGAVVRISAGFQAGDVLTFADQPAISATSYNAITGVLTLAGTASVADYQTALRSVGFRETGDNPSASRTVEFKANDGTFDSLPATKAIAITPVNDAPVVTTSTGALSFTEGDAAKPIDPGVTVADADSASIATATVQVTGNYSSSQDVLAMPFTAGIGSSYNSATGTLTLTGPASPAAFQAALRTVTYRNTSSNPSTAPRTVTFVASDGALSSAPVTRAINISAADNPPDVHNSTGALAYTENDPATAIDTNISITDVDSATLTGATVKITDRYFETQDRLALPAQPSITAGAFDTVTGTLTLSGTATIADYETALEAVTYRNTSDAPSTVTRTVTYTARDAGGFGTPDTHAITVAAVDDAPVAVNNSATVNEDDPAATLLVLNNDTDVDGGPKAIASASDPANGTVVLTGGSPGARTELTYQPDPNYCNSPPGTSPDTFTYTLTPGGSTATVYMTVTCSDDPPVAVADSATADKNSGPVSVDVLFNDSDVDGGPKLVQSVTQPANGSAVPTGGGTAVSYTPNAGYCNDPPGTSPDTFTYSLNGGSTATVSMTVTCPNAPVVDTSAGSLAYAENDPATPIDPSLGLTGDGTITSATAKVTAGYVATEDVLALAPAFLPIGVTAAVFGDTLTLSGNASPAQYEAMLRAVTYANSSENPATAARTVTFTATDDGALSGSDTRTIAVTRRNDPPVAVDDEYTTSEDGTLIVPAATGVLVNDTDIDVPDTKHVLGVHGGDLSQLLTGGRNLVMQGNGGFTFDAGSFYQDLTTGETATFTFDYTMQDSGGAQATATVTITITGASDAPVAVADSFDAIGNTGLFVGTTRPSTQAGKQITGSLLANDTDPDTPQANLVAVAVTKGTSAGGTVTIETDGNFTYHPDDADVGVSDSFSYTVSDGVASATGTVTIPITGQVWYVKNNQAAGGDGTSDEPFDTLVEAESADGPDDTVFVFDGNNTSANLDTGFRMESGERLTGQAAGLAVDPDGVGGLPASTLLNGTAGTAPTLTTTETEDVVAVNDGTLVSGFDIDPGAGGGGIGGGIAATGQTAATFSIANLHVNDTAPLGTQPGIELDGTTGSNAIAGVEVDTSGATGVRVNNAGTVRFQDSGTISLNTSGAKALDVGGGTIMAANSVIDDITVTGSDNGAVRVINVSGGLTLGDGVDPDLSLQTMSSPAPALDIASSNGVSIAAAGTDTISANGGPAVDIRNSFGSEFYFDSVSSTDSAGDGINLDTNLDSPFVALAGAISGAGTPADGATPAVGIGFDVDGSGETGDNTVSYGGAINDGEGPLSVEVTHRTGGAVTLSGNISDGVDAGGGIALSNNSGGTTTFSGTSKVLNTGASTAVSSTSSSSSSALSFTNGGLDIDATSGAGFDAVSGGTISVEGTGNTIDTTTGRALRIQSSPIADADVTLQRVSSNGAANGIVLNTTTNALGQLSVTGDGETCSSAATCSGGAIQNSTGDGISLSNVPGRVSLSHMQVSDSGASGIRAVSTNGVALSSSRIVDNGDAAAENGLDYFNVTGDWSIADTVVTGSSGDHVQVASSDTPSDPLAFSLDVTGSTFASTSTTTGGFGVGISLERAGTADVNITGNTFAANRQAAVVVAGGAAPTTINARVKSNTVTGGNVGAPFFENGIFVHGSHTGHTRVEIDQNTISGTRGRALVAEASINATAAAQFDATITSNTIGNGTAASGSETDAMFAQGDGSGSSRFAIRNNTIRNYAGRGLVLFTAGTATATATADYTVTQNTISDPSALDFPGVAVQSGNNGGTATMCANVGGAGVENSLGAAGPSGQPDVVLQRVSPADLRLPGFMTGGDPQAYIVGRNSGSPTVAVVDLAPAGQVGGCTLPALPPP